MEIHGQIGIHEDPVPRVHLAADSVPKVGDDDCTLEVAYCFTSHQRSEQPEPDRSGPEFVVGTLDLPDLDRVSMKENAALVTDALALQRNQRRLIG